MTVTGERQWIVDICETAMLAVLIAVSGVFRIPGLVPGTEFQLSPDCRRHLWRLWI